MGRSKIQNRNVRKLNKGRSGSYITTLPMEIIRDLGWKDRQKIQFRKSGQKIIIEDWKP